MEDKILTLHFYKAITLTINLNEITLVSASMDTASPSIGNTSLYLRPNAGINEKYSRQMSDDNKVKAISKKPDEVQLLFNFLVTDLSPNVVQVILASIKKLKDSPTIHKLTIDIKQINKKIDNFCTELPFELMNEAATKKE